MVIAGELSTGVGGPLTSLEAEGVSITTSCRQTQLDAWELAQRLGVSRQTELVLVGSFVGDATPVLASGGLFHHGPAVPRAALPAIYRSGSVSLGDGVDELAFHALAHEPGLRNVRFLGFRDHDELAQAYEAAAPWCFQPWETGNGLVVEEAMASGLPVTSTEAAGDIRLRVPQGVAGVVVPPANSELLADRMRMIAADPSATRRMWEAAAAIASARGHDRYADDFERFVERVLFMPWAR
jgi:glycosyltransferase involved in cell wall biosynthesis